MVRFRIVARDDNQEPKLNAEDPENRHIAAKLLGQAKSEAKAKAARENGKLGGRPKGTVVSDETKRKISETKRMNNAMNIQKESNG